MDPGLRFRRDGLLTAVPRDGFYGNAADWRKLRSAADPAFQDKGKVRKAALKRELPAAQPLIFPASLLAPSRTFARMAASSSS